MLSATADTINEFGLSSASLADVRLLSEERKCDSAQKAKHSLTAGLLKRHETLNLAIRFAA
ncbi:hypothetical protein CWB99_22215 [Pseudoalteromonas rubra]|uniref:Uncharacterized protein n=1 Tax=Pseudoalteromonas rubra TaxID=43658 RepID=A0A5S3WFE1_9GAMM|nr:hypothetical protein CWB99_22215 [Pseudoalteromonas rubra]TMP33300.1 hypothetical protein CWC00_11025 [Pseudoalteromonas rubra]